MIIKSFSSLEDCVDFFFSDKWRKIPFEMLEINQEDILLKIDERIAKKTYINADTIIFKILHKNRCFWYASSIFEQIEKNK